MTNNLTDNIQFK